MNPRTQMRSLLLAGLLPVILFTVIEEMYGTLWGLIAGMVFGVGEIAWELIKYRRVETMTWAGNGLLLGLGGISLLTDTGVWFKLQPSILEGVMGGVLIGSVILKRPLLYAMMKQQMEEKVVPTFSEKVGTTFFAALGGMTLRMGLFLWVHAGLAAWVALYGSTRVWAVLKGVGFTVSFIVYLVVESLLLRYRIAKTIPRKN